MPIGNFDAEHIPQDGRTTAAVLDVLAQFGGSYTDAQAAAAIAAAEAASLQKASNLSDVPNAGTARSSLGLGTAATHAATDFDTAGAAAAAQAAAVAAAEAASVLRDGTGMPASVAIVSSAQTFTKRQRFEADTTQLPGGATASAEILDPYGNVLSSLGPRSMAAICQKLAANLTTGVLSQTLVVIGDSTCSDTSGFPVGVNAKWVTLLATALAAQYPAYTVTYDQWDDTSQSYLAGNHVVVQTGAGTPPTLAIYNASMTGKAYDYFSNRTRIDAMTTTLTPDQIIVSLGKNEPSSPVNTAQSQARLLAFTEHVKTRNPQASLCLITQNPTVSPASSAGIIGKLRTVFAEVARTRGYDLMDIYQVFVNTGAYAASGTYTQADGVHPTVGSGNTGQQLWADAVQQAMSYRPGTPPRVERPSSLDEPGQNLLIGGDFAGWSGTGNPPGWTATNLTLSRVTTAGQIDQQQRFSLGAAATAGGVASLSQDAGRAGTRMGLLAGRQVSAAALVYLPAGQGISNGTLKLQDGITSGGSQFVWGGGDQASVAGLVWIYATLKLATNATQCTLLLYTDSNAGSAGGGNVVWLRAWLGFGTLPRDFSQFLPRSGLATLVAGTVTVLANIQAGNAVLLTPQDNSTTGILRVSSISTGGNFVITSSVNTDTGVVGWMLV